MQDILKNLKKKITGEDCYRIVCLIALYTKYHITKKHHYKSIIIIEF